MKKLTLEEAINHAKKVATQMELDNCKECAENHKQLAAWLKELEAYKNAEQQSLLVKLPCKIGDAIYRMTPETLVPITRDIIMQITICDGFILLHGEVISEIDAAEIGETAFLSMEEADRKLKELTE